MPKPRSAPAPLVIEGLSDGREIRPKDFVDDFTGEVIPVPPDDKPKRVMLTPDEIARVRHRARMAKAQEIMAMLPRSVTSAPKMVVPSVPNMRPIAQIGNSVVMVVNKPWRRV